METQIEKLQGQDNRLKTGIEEYEQKQNQKGDEAYNAIFAQLDTKNEQREQLDQQIKQNTKKLAKFEVAYFEAFDAIHALEDPENASE